MGVLEAPWLTVICAFWLFVLLGHIFSVGLTESNEDKLMDRYRLDDEPPDEKETPSASDQPQRTDPVN